MPRIALAVAAAFGDVDTDLPLLTAAAERAGVDVDIVAWDDPATTWADYALVVVRSCWDYVPRREEFLSWTRTVPRLANSARAIEWNTDKTYLRDLEAAGVAIIPTAWSVRDAIDLPGGTEEWVVKPTISAGSADTARWSDPARAIGHSRELLSGGRATMTQPYIEAIDTEGEIGLLFFGGRYSHAFRKGPLLSLDVETRGRPGLQEEIDPCEASASQITFAEHVISVATHLLGESLLYARVDIVTGPDGALRLMELELTEPSFFLEHAPAGADAAVAAIQEIL